MHKKRMNHNLIHCCVCGHTIGEKCNPGTTVDGMPLMCSECGAKMAVYIDTLGHRTVKEI